MAKLLQRFWVVEAPAVPVEGQSDGESGEQDLQSQDLSAADDAYPVYVSTLALGFIVALVPLTVFYGKQIAPWIIPGLMILLLGFGVAKRVRVYECFVEGAKDGFNVALRIIPYLVAILVAVGMDPRQDGGRWRTLLPLETGRRIRSWQAEGFPWR